MDKKYVMGLVLLLGDRDRDGVFARVVDKKYVMGADGLLDAGTLGGRPFVFVTLPETFYSRTPLQMFSAIGYSAEDVLTGQLGKDKVRIVFRWEGTVVTHPGRAGVLPAAWDRAVSPATWDNLFAQGCRIIEVAGG